MAGEQRTRRQRTAATSEGAATASTAPATGTSDARTAEGGTGGTGSAEGEPSGDTGATVTPADDAGQAGSGAATGDAVATTPVSEIASDNSEGASERRVRLAREIEDHGISDAVVAAVLDAKDAGALTGVGEGVRFVLEPIGDGDVATLSEDADAVIDGIVAGKVPVEVLAALRTRLDPFAADIGGTHDRYAVSGEVRRRFPVVSDVMNGGKLIEAGGDVIVTEREFEQLRAGLSIEATWTWIDGDPVQGEAAGA